MLTSQAYSLRADMNVRPLELVHLVARFPIDDGPHCFSSSMDAVSLCAELASSSSRSSVLGESWYAIVVVFVVPLRDSIAVEYLGIWEFPKYVSAGRW